MKNKNEISFSKIYTYKLKEFTFINIFKKLFNCFSVKHKEIKNLIL